MGAILAILGDRNDPELKLRMRRMIDRSPYRGTPTLHAEPGFVLAVMSVADDASLVVSHGRVVAVHGWIGNWPELAAEHALEFPVGATDAERVAAAYDALGDRLFAALRGDWATALCEPTARRLLAARDALGCCPLYWHRRSARIFVASEIRQLIAGSGATAELDQKYVARWLFGDYRNDPGTSHREVFRVRPSWLTVFDGEARQGDPDERRYWTPPCWGGSLDDHGSIDEIVEDLRHIVARSVRRACTGRRFAIAVSGGLDSTLLLGLAARARWPDGGTPLDGKPYSLVFPGNECDESRHIEEVFRFNRTAGVLIDGAACDVLSMMVETAGEVDSPPFPGTGFMSLVASRAAADGRPLLATGNGGDQWFWSHDMFLPHLLLNLRLLQFSRDAADLARQLNQSLPFVMLRRGLAPLAKGAIGYASRYRRPFWANASAWQTFFRRPAAVNPWRAGGVPYAQANLVRRIEAEQSGCVLEVAEQAAASRRVALRYPLLDLDLIEHLLTIPPRMLAGGPRWRDLQRRVGQGLIPDSVRLRLEKTPYTSVLTEPALAYLGSHDPKEWFLVREQVLDADGLCRLRDDSEARASTVGMISTIVACELFASRFQDRCS